MPSNKIVVFVLKLTPVTVTVTGEVPTIVAAGVSDPTDAIEGGCISLS